MVFRLAALLLCCTLLSRCQAPQKPAAPPEEEVYTFGEPSEDGTGKFYLGREIAQVMGHQGAGWLERPEREKEEGVSQAMQNMQLQAGEYVADIGAGSGYYTFRLAGRVPNGKVFAVDLQPEMLDLIRRTIEENSTENVVPVQGQEKDPNLPDNSVDMVLMVDVYHELSYPKEMMQQVVRALKPGGRFVLLEYRMEDPQVPIKRLHKMSLEQAVREMKVVGLQLKENVTNLPWQHFMVFVKD